MYQFQRLIFCPIDYLTAFSGIFSKIGPQFSKIGQDEEPPNGREVVLPIDFFFLFPRCLFPLGSTYWPRDLCFFSNSNFTRGLEALPTISLSTPNSDVDLGLFFNVSLHSRNM